jgi:hypothetical protein
VSEDSSKEEIDENIIVEKAAGELEKAEDTNHSFIIKVPLLHTVEGLMVRFNFAGVVVAEGGIHFEEKSYPPPGLGADMTRVYVVGQVVEIGHPVLLAIEYEFVISLTYSVMILLPQRPGFSDDGIYSPPVFLDCGGETVVDPHVGSL